MRFLSILMISLITSAVTAQDKLTTDEQRFSYAVGVQIGQNIASQPTDVDSEALLMGISDIIRGEGLKLTGPEMQAAIVKIQQQEQQRQQAQGAQNQAAGEKFLAENRNNKDVTETGTGLQYKVLIEGDGIQPKATDEVVVHYRGALLDGTEFDSSYNRGQPVTISLDSVIPGWREVVPMMKVGSKWKVFVPSELGYGPNAAGPIGPNSTLIFDIELLAVNN